MDGWTYGNVQVQPVQEHTIARAIADYLADCEARNLAANTVGSYRRSLIALQEYCDARQVSALADLTVDFISDFRRDRRWRPRSTRRDDSNAGVRPLSGSSARLELVVVRQLLNWCMKRKRVAENNAQAVELPKDDHKPTLPFEPDEVERLVAACDHVCERVYRHSLEKNPHPKRARAIVYTLLYSALRIGDLATLRRSSLDPKTGVLFLRTEKTDEPVSLRLHRDAVEALLALPVDPRHPDRFFPSDGSHETHTTNLRRTTQTVGKIAGVANVHPHRFRDTFAVALIERGVPVERIRLLLGHDSLQTTIKRYLPWVRRMQALLDNDTALLDFTSPRLQHPDNVVPFESRRLA